MSQTIGYIGCFFLSIYLIPQVLKTYKTKKTEGISPLFIGIGITASVLMLTYGALIRAYPVVISNTIILINNILLMSLYLKYNNEEVDKKTICCIILK